MAKYVRSSTGGTFFGSAVRLAGLELHVPYTSHADLTSGDVTLELVRTNFLDITPPYITPRNDRLPNVSVISAVSVYEKPVFLINTNLLSAVNEVIWTHSFGIDIWVMIILWRLWEILPSCRPRCCTQKCGSFQAGGVIQLLFAVFEFYVTFFNTEYLLQNSLKEIKPPFSNLFEAVEYVAKNKDSSLVQYPFLSGSIGPGMFRDRIIMAKSNEHLRRLILDNEKYFDYTTTRSSRYLKEVRCDGLTGYTSGESVTYAVAFCRPDFAFKEAITIALMKLNDMGMTYFDERYFSSMTSATILLLVVSTSLINATIYPVMCFKACTDGVNAQYASLDDIASARGLEEPSKVAARVEVCRDSCDLSKDYKDAECTHF